MTFVFICIWRCVVFVLSYLLILAFFRKADEKDEINSRKFLQEVIWKGCSRIRKRGRKRKEKKHEVHALQPRKYLVGKVFCSFPYLPTPFALAFSHYSCKPASAFPAKVDFANAKLTFCFGKDSSYSEKCSIH